MRISFFARLVLTTLTILAIPYVISGVAVDGVFTAVLAAVLLLFFNVTLKPFLILLTLPLTVLSLGLFLFVVNALVFGAMAYFLPGLHVASFASAFGAALLLSAMSWLVNLGVDNQGGRRIVVVRHSGQGPGGNPMRDLN